MQLRQRAVHRNDPSDFFHLPVELQLEYLPLLDDWSVEENWVRIDELQQATALFSERLGRLRDRCRGAR